MGYMSVFQHPFYLICNASMGAEQLRNMRPTWHHVVRKTPWANRMGNMHSSFSTEGYHAPHKANLWGFQFKPPLLIWATCCNQSNEGRFSVLSSTIYEIKLSLHNGHHDLTLIKWYWHKIHQFLSWGVSLSLSFLCFSLLRPLPSLLCCSRSLATPTRLAAMPCISLHGLCISCWILWGSASLLEATTCNPCNASFLGSQKFPFFESFRCVPQDLNKGYSRSYSSEESFPFLGPWVQKPCPQLAHACSPPTSKIQMTKTSKFLFVGIPKGHPDSPKRPSRSMHLQPPREHLVIFWSLVGVAGSRTFPKDQAEEMGQDQFFWVLMWLFPNLQHLCIDSVL